MGVVGVGVGNVAWGKGHVDSLVCGNVRSCALPPTTTSAFRSEGPKQKYTKRGQTLQKGRVGAMKEDILPYACMCCVVGALCSCVEGECGLILVLPTKTLADAAPFCLRFTSSSLGCTRAFQKHPGLAKTMEDTYRVLGLWDFYFCQVYGFSHSEARKNAGREGLLVDIAAYVPKLLSY